MFGIPKCLRLVCIEFISNVGCDQAFYINKCIKSSLNRFPEAINDLSQI
jgi:hypothetical protein